MLSLENADAFYGKAQVLRGVSLKVTTGEIVSLIGRNGAGKSTMLRALCGLMPLASGRLFYSDQNVFGRPAHWLSRQGINYVPETRRIFPNLSVEENLKVAAISHKVGYWTMDRVFGLFPRLKERLRSQGDTLSGGEQQMLAIARGLLTAPKIMLLDEPTEGLAPIIVDAVVDAIRVIQREGVGVVLVEQKLSVPLALASRQYVIENGQMVWTGPTAELVANRDYIERLIGL